MSRRVTLTVVEGAEIAVGAEHVEAVAPVTIEVPPDTPGAYPKEVVRFYGAMSVERTDHFLDCTEVVLGSGDRHTVREPVDEVAALVWPAAWQTCHCAPGGVLDDDHDAPPGYAPIGPWEPVDPAVFPEHASILASGHQWTFKQALVVVFRRPLRRVGGDQ